MKRLVLLICAILFLQAIPVNAYGTKQSETITAGERTRLFNTGWQFQREGESGWTETDLPHDCSIFEPFSAESEAESGFLPGGKGTYRKTVILAEELAGKRILLEAEGISQNAEVRVNGRLLGTHPYSYTGFAFDLSRDLIADGKTENELLIGFDNEIPGSRWYSGSGIFRDLKLTVCDPVCIGRYGVIITPKTSETECREVQAELTAENHTGRDCEADVLLYLSDENGMRVSEQKECSLLIPAGGSEKATVSFTGLSLALWDVDNPVQYLLHAELKDRSGKHTDELDIRFGCRNAVFDPDKGFFLNGKNRKLKGVCLHHDLGSLGAAEEKSALMRRLDLLQEMGINAVRTAHNPASSFFLEQCSSRGILVIEEAFDTWTNAKNYNMYDYSRCFAEPISGQNEILNGKPGMTWAEYDCREMVRHSRNEPCVILYSIGNEILGNIGGDTSEYGRYAEELCSWIREECTDKPVTIADNMTLKENALQMELDQAVADAGGVIGLNYATGESMERYHAEHPEWCLYGSETASAYGSRGEYAAEGIDQTRFQITAFDRESVEWGMRAEDAWKHTVSRDFIAGEFIWTGFDYLGEPEPWNKLEPGSLTDGLPHPNRSYFGVIDTAGLKKDSFYFYQSQWRDDLTVLHILPDWNPDNLAKGFFNDTAVTVYTNAPQVELFLNGRSLGRVKAETVTTEAGHSYRTYNGSLSLNTKVRFQPGELTAAAYDENGTLISVTSGRNTVRTPSASSRIQLSVSAPQETDAGRKLVYVIAALLDQNGNPVSGADQTITFSVKGGTVISADNGDPASLRGYGRDSETSAVIDTFHGKAVLIAQLNDGEELEVTAEGEGLSPGRCAAAAAGREPSGFFARTVYELNRRGKDQ